MARNTAHVVVFLLLLSLISIGRARAAPPSDEERLQGLWRVAKFTDPARSPTPQDISPLSVLIKSPLIVQIQGDELTALFPAPPQEGLWKWQFSLLPDERPKQVRFRDREGEGIYELTNDRLIVTLDRSLWPHLGLFFGVGNIFGVKKAGEPFRIELERLSEEYASALIKLQGVWKIVSGGPLEQLNGRIVVVGGEAGVVMRKNATGLIVFRLEPGKEPRGAELSGFPESMEPRHGIYRMAGDELEMCFGAHKLPRPVEFKSNEKQWLLTLVRRTEEEYMEEHAASELKQLRGRKWKPIDHRNTLQLFIDGFRKQRTGRPEKPTDHKEALRQFIDRFPNTQAAREAQQELEQIPSDALERAKDLFLTDPAAATEQYKSILKEHPGTKAAAEAELLLDPPAREKAAERRLTLAKSLLTPNPEAARRRLQEIVDEYPETKAAEEAKQLLEQRQRLTRGGGLTGASIQHRAESVFPAIRADGP